MPSSASCTGPTAWAIGPGGRPADGVRPAGIEQGLSLDGLAGFTYTYLNLDLKLKGTGPLGLERHFSGDQQWATPWSACGAWSA